MILDARVSKMKKKFDPSVVSREERNEGRDKQKLGFNPKFVFFLFFFLRTRKKFKNTFCDT